MVTTGQQYQNEAKSRQEPDSESEDLDNDAKVLISDRNNKEQGQGGIYEISMPLLSAWPTTPRDKHRGESPTSARETTSAAAGSFLFHPGRFFGIQCSWCHPSLPVRNLVVMGSWKQETRYTA